MINRESKLSYKFMNIHSYWWATDKWRTIPDARLSFNRFVSSRWCSIKSTGSDLLLIDCRLIASNPSNSNSIFTESATGTYEQISNIQRIYHSRPPPLPKKFAYLSYDFRKRRHQKLIESPMETHGAIWNTNRAVDSFKWRLIDLTGWGGEGEREGARSD